MSPARVNPLRKTGRIVLLWLLAWVVPLQCGASVVRLAAGPAHSHSIAAPAAPELDLRDFRRQPTVAVHAHHDTGPAHRHGPGARHHHAADDATVIASDLPLDRLDRLDAQDDGAGSGAVAPLLPLLPTTTSWQAPNAVHAPPGGLAWWAASRFGARLERPPRGETA